MPASVYPETLPGPLPGSIAPRVRRADSSLPGPVVARPRQRDGAGAAHEYSYVYTAAEMAVWRDWYADELRHGRRWFSAVLPGRGGLSSRVARYTAVRQSYLGGGIYRIAASLELRGASVSPQYEE